MTRSKRWTIAAASLALALPLVGCEEAGPAERAGRAIDDAAESAKEGLNDLVEDDGPLEKAGRKVDEAIDDAVESMNE